LIGDRLVVDRELRLRMVADRMEEPVRIGHDARRRHRNDLIETGGRLDRQLLDEALIDVGMCRRIALEQILGGQVHAPDLGVRLQTDSGLSAECVRTGEILLCHDVESNPRVDLASCRRLGARSILVAPLRHCRRTLGVFEVLSATPYAFDHHDVSTMQLLSGVLVAAMTRLCSMRPLREKWPA